MSNQPQNHEIRAVSALSTEAVNPATREIDRVSTLEVVQLMNAEDAKVAQAIQEELPSIAQALEAIAERMRRGGRIIYIGAGTSGRLGILDASEIPPTFNTSPEQVVGLIAGGPIAVANAQEDAEDSPEAGQAELERQQITEADCVVGIAASGRTPYVLGAISYAQSCGALTIGIACNKHTPLTQAVTISIAPEVGPEVITGSTRLKAGTAQKMILNMLSTGTMILLGKTYGNLMVDVKATNYKLEQRAVKIVQLATDSTKEQAEQLLQQADGETKTAIIIGRTHVTPEQARTALANHNNILRSTLDAMQP